MRRYGVGAGLVLATALVAPAQAHHERYITLTGSRSGYVDMTFTRDVAFFTHLSRFGGSASLAGFVVRRLDQPMDPISSLWIRGRSPITQGIKAVVPGRYRIHLLADGPATIRIHTEGGVRSHLTPRLRPSPVVTNGGPIPVGKQATQRWYGERTTRVPFEASMVFAAYHVTLPPTTMPTWGSVTSCTTTGEAVCPGADTAGYVPPSATPPRSAYGSSYSAGYVRGDVIHHYYAGSTRPEAAGSAVFIVGL